MKHQRGRRVWARSPKRCRTGAAIIETAIGFTVLIVMVFGVIEAALFYQDYEMLANITREAARRMAVGSTAGVTGTAIPKALQWNMGNSNFTTNTVNFTIEQSKDASSTGWTAVSPNTMAKSGYWVRVRSTYVHKNITFFFGSSCTLPATAIMRVENGS